MTFLAVRALLGRIWSAVPLWAWVLLLTLSWGGLQRHSATVALQKERAAEQQLAEIRAEAAQAAIDILARQVATEQGAIHVAQAETTRLASDRAAADAALRRLLDRVAAADRAAQAARAAGGGASAPAGAGVCADVLGRLGALGRRYAEIADARGTPGRACERIGSGGVTP